MIKKLLSVFKLDKISNQHRGILILTIVLMFALGVIISIQATILYRRLVYLEFDGHLMDMASTVDHNTGDMLDRCRSDIANIVKSSEFQQSEADLYKNGTKALMTSALQKSVTLLTRYSGKILAIKNNTVVMSSDENDSLDYSLMLCGGSSDVWHCADNSSGESYIGISSNSETLDYTYCVLVDLDVFFRRVVVDTLYENHWIVLYDSNTGLTMQNDSLQPQYLVMPDDEIISRDDGYKKIFDREHSGESGVDEYSYFNKDDSRTHNARLYSIPTSVCENNIFTIAVAVYNDNIFSPMRTLSFLNIIAACLVAFSAAAAVFFLLHSSRKARELANEITALETEKRLSDEMLQNQEQLAHHQKLETIGTLTAGIAHEFNNLLSPIMGNSMLILEKTRTTDQEVFDNAMDIYSASSRAKNLVMKISGLSRRQFSTQMQPVSPQKLISDVLSLSSVSIPGNILVNESVSTGRQILGIENQLEHMLLNLVINAVQSIGPDAGTITISAESDDENVYISVSDTGKGIPEDKLEYIFDPFFTTKDVGKGTGLGLSIAQNTAISHGGSIKAENLPKGGARFTFTAKIYKPYAE